MDRRLARILRCLAEFRCCAAVRFNDRDDARGPRVAIIDEALARQFWPNGEPLGERLLLGKGYGPEFEEPARQIVGVVGDVRNFGTDSRIPRPSSMSRSRKSPMGLLRLPPAPQRWFGSPAHGEIPASSAPQFKTSSSKPAADCRWPPSAAWRKWCRNPRASEDFNTLLMSIFGCTALLLAAIGVYGLMAYSVAQRTQEIGIRLALGAEPANVRNMVILQGMRLAALGIAIGLASSFGLTRLIASSLFGVKPHDPVAFTAGSGHARRSRAVRGLAARPSSHPYRPDDGSSLRIKANSPRPVVPPA